MGIERNNRKPKRQRTPSQRIKGRMKPAFNLPEKGTESVKKKAKPAASDTAKPKIEKKAPSKTTGKKKIE